MKKLLQTSLLALKRISLCLCVAGLSLTGTIQAEEITVEFNFTSLVDIQSYNEKVPPISNWDLDNSNKQYLADKITFTKDNFSITASEGTGTGVKLYFYSQKYDFRLSSGNEMKFEAPNGYQIESILLVSTSLNTQINKIVLPEGHPGTLTNNSSEKSMTWKAPEEGSILSVSLGTTGATRIGTITITASEIPTVDIPTPEYPENLYFIGNTLAFKQELWPAWDVDNPIEFQNDGDGIFILKGVELQGADDTAYFCFLKNIGSYDNRYCGVSGQSWNLTASEDPIEFTLYETNGDQSWTLPNGVYDFEVSFEEMTFLVTASDVPAYTPPAPTAPENLYIMGNIEDKDWKPQSAPALTVSEDGVFKISEVTLVAAGGDTNDPMAYFTFINLQTSDWDVINDGQHRYGPETNGTVASLETANEFGLVGDVSWKINPGTYDFTVNFNTLEVTITESVVVVPPTMEEYNVFVYNSTDWEKVYLYMTNDEKVEYMGEWPGETTTETKTVKEVEYLVFTVELPEGSTQDLIFNNGDKTQLKALSYTFTDDLYVEITAEGATKIDPETFVPEPGGDGDDTGGISQLKNDSECVIYNLQGVRVDCNKLGRGVYIINRKKVLVK